MLDPVSDVKSLEQEPPSTQTSEHQPTSQVGSISTTYQDNLNSVLSGFNNLQVTTPVAALVPNPSEQTNFPAPAMLTGFKDFAKAAPKVNTSDSKELEEFLGLVAEGEQGKAEVMLKKNPELALVAGDVRDLSKRTFNGITGFQYAVWALDWHMWTMIRKYLPDEVAREQAQGFETGSWVKTHGVHVNLNILIQAYQTSIDLYNAKKYTEGDTAWVQQVGGAQLLLPAHVINEYCHPTRSFYPLPNFKDAVALPLSRKRGKEDWFTAEYSGGKLGEKFAFYRGECVGSTRGVAGLWVRECDHDSIRLLTSTRTAQREELIAELRTRSVVNNPQTTSSVTNPLLQSLRMQLMKGEGQSAAYSPSHKQTDAKISLGTTLAHDLEEIEKEKQELGQTSQALKTQSEGLQEILQKEITVQESEYALLKQQQAEFKEQIADLQKSLTQKTSIEQGEIQASLKALQEQLLVVQIEQEVLLNEHKAKAQKREALRRFQSHPNLLLFYRTVHIKLEEIFISFKAVAGGFVDPVEGNVAIAKSIFDALGDTASIVPIVGTAVDKFLKWTVSKGLEKIDSTRQKNTARNASGLVTLSEVKKYAESIARRLTERYADQLVERLKTPEEEQAATHELKQAFDKTKEMVLKGSSVSSAKQLAAFGVLWMIDQLYDAENIDTSKELDEALLSVISQKTPPNKIKEFWQKITTGLGIQGLRSKSGEIWHPEAVYTLPGLRVGDKYYSSGTLQPTTYGWRLGTDKEVKALGLREVPAPATQAFVLEIQKVVPSISMVNKNIQQMQQETKEHSEILETMKKTGGIAGSARLQALEEALAQAKKEIERLAELARAASPSPSPKRRPSGIKDFAKQSEQENMLDALKELRKFFLGQRDKGGESANIETYEKYLKMANKDAELIYQQEDRIHVLCIDGNVLDRTAAAQAIGNMIKALDPQTQPTVPAARPPVRAVSPSPVNSPKAAPMTAPSASFEQHSVARMLNQFQQLPLPTAPAALQAPSNRLNTARQMKKETS